MLVLGLVLDSLNLKYPPQPVSFVVPEQYFQINFQHLISSSVVRWSGDPHFLVQGTVDFKSKIGGFCYILSLFFWLKNFGVFVLFVNDVHNHLVDSMVVVLIRKFLFHFRICKTEHVIFVKEIVVCANWYSCLCSFALKIFWFNIRIEFLRLSSFIGRLSIRR